MSSLILSQEQKEAKLTERELREYRIYMRLKQPPMAESTQKAFFELFQNGINCEEVHKLNPHGFSLGAIVRARIENDWDIKREEHQRRLLEATRPALQQTQLEVVDALRLELVASMKYRRDKILRYMQTGDENEIVGLGIGTLKHMKEVAQVLLPLTGQDAKKSKVEGVIEHRHSTTDQPAIPAAAKPVASDSAAGWLEVIRKNRQEPS